MINYVHLKYQLIETVSLLKRRTTNRKRIYRCTGKRHRIIFNRIRGRKLGRRTDFSRNGAEEEGNDDDIELKYPWQTWFQRNLYCCQAMINNPVVLS